MTAMDEGRMAHDKGIEVPAKEKKGNQSGGVAQKPGGLQDKNWGNIWRKLLNRRENSKNLRMPNLIGVGVGRCGTTSLFETFRNTSGIFTPDIKELTYFSAKHRDVNPQGWLREDYMLFFDGWTDEPLAAEVSPQYFHDPEVPRRIREECPEAKIIIQFREPVERMVSLFNRHAQFHGHTDVNEYTEVAMTAFNEGRSSKKFFHPSSNLRKSFYAEGIRRYLDVFGEGQVAMVHLDHYKDASGAVSQMLSEFTGVEISINAEKRDNASSDLAGVEKRSTKLSSENIAMLRDIFAQDYAASMSLYKEIRFTPLRYGAQELS